MVRIAFTLAALNSLEVMAGHAQNTHLNTTCNECIWTILGPEFRPELQGKKATIFRSGCR